MSPGQHGRTLHGVQAIIKNDARLLNQKRPLAKAENITKKILILSSIRINDIYFWEVKSFKQSPYQAESILSNYSNDSSASNAD